MRKLTGLFVLCFLLSANALQAAEPEKVTSAAESTEISTDKEKKEKVANDGDNYKKFRFGGYGEMVASFKDYGIAAMALGKGAYAIHQSGKWYTDDNIDQMLM